MTQLIARRVREAGVYCEIAPFQSAEAAFERLQPKGIILSGSPAGVPEEGSPRAPQILFDSGVPILGICYGQQVMSHQLGGTVEAGQRRRMGGEFGRAFLTVTEECALFDGLWEVGERHQVWMSHGDKVTEFAPGFRIVAGQRRRAVRGHRRRGAAILRHPVPPRGRTTPPTAPSCSPISCTSVCGVAGDWSMAAYRDAKIADIRAQVGDGKVICGLSGGVDSSVAAILIHEAIGNQLTCVFVDHGLLRLNEREQVESLFRDHYNIPLVVVDAEERFMAGLAGVTDPEAKRKFIGGEFIAVFEEEAAKLGGADFLAQGTLYPDVIESVSFTGGPCVTIKSHHNVGGLPERMNMKLVEPLARIVQGRGARAGPRARARRAFVGRHPFPGPGLAIRIPGEVTKERCDILRKADAIYLEEIRNAGLYDAIWQAFAVLLPVQDGRRDGRLPHL